MGNDIASEQQFHSYKINKRPRDDISDDDTEDDEQKSKIDADNKDKQIIDEAFKRIRERNITNTKDYTLQLMNKEYEYHQKQNENKKKKKKEKLSQLTDDTNHEMCRMGHCYWQSGQQDIENHGCIICGSLKETKVCAGCYYYAKQRLGIDDAVAHIYCQGCRVKNAEDIKKRIKMDKFKAEIIRQELIETPELELDLLCNMPRRASVDTLIKDINKLSNSDRSKWCLFVFDMDHLKIWNTCLGHVRTDLMIKKIGNEMKKYVKDINNGRWKSKEKGELVQSFAFRTGGDEFCFAVKTDNKYGTCGIENISLGPFYFSLKKDINAIGLNIKVLFGENEEKEYKNAMEALDNAKDRDKQRIKMNKVGISTGLYIPHLDPKDKRKENWLYYGDKEALEHAKTLNPPVKNDIAIYYERKGGLIYDEKTLKCLETCACKCSK